MNPSEYSVHDLGRCFLVRTVGTRPITLVSDSNKMTVHEIYRKICAGAYATERELFDDIFARYRNRSIIPVIAT